MKHGEKEDFPCIPCGRVFRLEKELTEHAKKHMEKKVFSSAELICTVCDKGFSSNKKLSDHEKKHSKNRKFSCSVCGETFKLRKEKTEHELFCSNSDETMSFEEKESSGAA